MSRVTKADAQRAMERLAITMGKPFSPMTEIWNRVDGRNVATIGIWFLDWNPTYGGARIEEISSNGGGTGGPLTQYRLAPAEFVRACEIAQRAVTLVDPAAADRRWFDFWQTPYGRALQEKQKQEAEQLSRKFNAEHSEVAR